MIKFNCFIILLVVLLAWSCEYNPVGENFNDLTPPERNIPVEITLNEINPSDTIFVYKNTNITINIKSTMQLVKADVLLNNNWYTSMQNSTTTFSINPAQYDDGPLKLKVNAIFTSGTGSLAELMGYEGYVGELTWNIVIVNDPSKYLTTGYRTDKDGFMEVFWNLGLPDNTVDKYTLSSGLTQSSDIIITNPKQKSFIDYGYVCGYAYYQITIYLKGGYAFTRYLSVDIPAPKNVYFENISLENLRIYWNKPYANGRFILSCDSKIIASNITDTSITIPQIFGGGRQFSLEIRPQKADYDNFHNRYSAWNWHRLGESLGLPNWELYAYNKIDNILYSRIYGSLVAFDASTMKQINTVEIPGNPYGFAYGGKIATAPHSSTVAAMTGEETWIFQNKNFVNPVKINPLPGSVNTRLSAITANDRLFVVQGGGSKVCKVFSSLSGALLFEFPFSYPTIYDIPDLVTVSEDGRYFCASSEKGVEIFKITGTTPELIYTDTRYYKGASFIPSQPERILFRVNTDLEIREIPDFKLIQSLNVSPNGALFCNIDPANLNLLYLQNDSLKVCNISNLSATLFKIRSNERDSKLLNNKIITYGKGGIYLDISTYTNK